MGTTSKAAAVVASGLLVATSAMAQDLPTHPSINFATGSPTGGWFPVAAVIAEATNELYQGQPVSVTPSAGGVGNALAVGSGEAQIGISYSPFLLLAQQGENDLYAMPGFPDLRAISAMTVNALHIVVSESLDLGEAVTAGEGLNLATGPTGSTELFMIQEVLDSYGSSIEDVRNAGGRVDLLNTAGRSDGWSNRQFDVANFFINPPAADIISMMTSRPDSRLLSLDSEIVTSIAEEWGMIEVTIPAGTYPNQDEDVTTLGMPYLYFTSADADEELIYNLTKTIANSKARLVNTHASFEEWEPESMVSGVGIELHPGAERFYREMGWID